MIWLIHIILGGFYKLALERFETICEQIYFQGRRDVAGYGSTFGAVSAMKVYFQMAES